MPDLLPLITSDRLYLRLALPDDVAAIINYYSENKTYLTPFHPRWFDSFFTETFWQKQVNQNIKEFRKDRALKLFIFPRLNPETIIGNVDFVRGSAQFCFLGYNLAEVEQGKGYMTEALQSTIPYIFQNLNLHRVMANYMPHNQRSGKLLKRLGFIEEGYAKNYLLVNGKMEDHILTSLTNPHWKVI
ncbi:MAG: GNAT family N-acetyltransferase [Kastovskya adunca ATA6-11-RM4]|jgi:ribosomal-protein-alanine N-acetyltransferase|nr:GNAT family N-acetyltransferase [Kastovskya adunca ATA6-11-RM4]